MIRVKLDYSDGGYTMRKHDAGDVSIPDELWTRYEAYQRETGVWDFILRILDNYGDAS